MYQTGPTLRTWFCFGCYAKAKPSTTFRPFIRTLYVYGEIVRSYWNIEYVGSHTNIFIKKLERHLKIKAIEIESERVVYDGKKLEHADFFLSHNQASWEQLVVEMLKLSNKLCHSWHITGELGENFSASLNIEESMYDPAVPSGLVKVSWSLNRSQVYSRFKYLNNHKAMW